MKAIRAAAAGLRAERAAALAAGGEPGVVAAAALAGALGLLALVLAADEAALEQVRAVLAELGERPAEEAPRALLLVSLLLARAASGDEGERAEAVGRLFREALDSATRSPGERAECLSAGAVRLVLAAAAAWDQRGLARQAVGRAEVALAESPAAAWPAAAAALAVVLAPEQAWPEQPAEELVLALAAALAEGREAG